jgi:hypothetical protein
VLNWNSIPTSNGPPPTCHRQPDFTTAVANNSSKLCESNGTDEETGDPTYPARCARTWTSRVTRSATASACLWPTAQRPRSDLQQRPTTNAPTPDVILGQFDPEGDQVSDSANELFRAATDVIRTPMSLAWDAARTLRDRHVQPPRHGVLRGDVMLPYSAVRNSASREVHAVGTITLAGTITKDDKITITISRESDSIENKYEYKVKEDDDLETIVDKLVALINAGDGNPLVFATPNKVLLQSFDRARAW